MRQTAIRPRPQRLYETGELAERIRAGGRFFVAGDEEALRRLPRGAWVGGTIPYFMAEEGGVADRGRVFATEIPADAASAQIRLYDAQSLFGVYRDAPDNGFSLIVMPAQSPTHLSFALNAPRYESFAARPLIGWVAGAPLEELGRIRPKVFDGRDGRALEDGAAVVHVRLPQSRTADVGLVNLFEPGDGDALTFEADGFSAREVLVGGRRRRFVDYAREKGLDPRLPLVADVNGARVNISFQALDAETGEARFYAPVFKGVEYRHARPVGDYVAAFERLVPEGLAARVAYSCNCVLNYVHAGLAGRRTAGITGPFTFGEIAYQLLNQTLVYLTVSDASLADRLRVQSPLRRQYQFLETMIDTIPTPVFYEDVQGRCLGCNKAYEDFFGRPKSWIVGRTTGDLLPAEVAAAERAVDEALLRRPHPAASERPAEISDASGSPRSLVVRKATFAGADGKAAGIICAITDVTESRRSERRLSAAYEELKSAQDQLVQSQKMAAVGRLAGGVAHEINNPLGVILGFAQSACRRLEEGDALALPLRSIEREALRCKSLVKDLLVFSRASSSDDLAEADLGAVVEASVSLLATRARLEGVEIAVERAADLPRVRGNANQLQQVVMNLAGNAMDAMPGGGRLTLATRRSARDAGVVELAVGDTGAGIPEDVRPRVFEPFFTTKEPGKGTGLGLALVFEIVRKHGGRVELDSEVGKGTTFVVSLPAAPA